MVDTLINLIVVLTPQCARISSRCAVYFKYIQLCQLYLSDAGEKAKICQGKSPNHDVYIHVYFFFFFFPVLPQVACSISKTRLKKKQKLLGILIEVALNLQFADGRIDVFIIVLKAYF